MFRKLIYTGLISLVLILAVGGVSYAYEGLVAYWPLDDGAGQIARDASGNGYDGVLGDNAASEASDPVWVADPDRGNVLEFSSSDPDWVNLSAHVANFQGLNQGTIMGWCKCITDGSGPDTILSASNTNNPSSECRLTAHQTNGGGIVVRDGAQDALVWVDKSNWDAYDGNWHFLAATVDAGGTIKVYGDGVLYNTAAGLAGIFFTWVDNLNGMWLGKNIDNGGNQWRFNGRMSDVAVFDQPLSANEIIEIFYGADILAQADMPSRPNPADGETDVPPDVTLSWTPGESANTHDVYFGESFEDVNAAMTASTVYQGRQSETTYAMDRLDFGQTYYWRIDEVNAPPDNTIFKGDLWRFTVEPVAYPIAGENIIDATASSSNAADEGPENTVNGSGLDDNDLHSKVDTDMWLSSTIGPQPTWIQYEFDRVYKLHQMLVWNYNTSLELVIGFGIKEATIEYSVDGTSWTTLGTNEFARGSGTAGYAHNTTVDLSGVVAKYVKITANSNWGGFMPQYGLSEVRFFYVPVWPREPNPASGTTDMDVDNVALRWRAGREAVSHEVHLSDSNQAVIDGTALVATVSEASYDTGELQLNQSYYWKITEVNEAETPTNWEGDVLNFTTREFLVIEDFEDYNNSSPHRVFQRWIDGIGFSADEFFSVENPGNGTGAALGHDIWSFDSPHYDGDIMETAIVHGGAQSAPLYYDNSIAPFTSEIVCTFNVPQDWTKHGIKTLSLWFYGDPNNVAQQMYVKLNGTKVLYDGDATNITRIGWQPWNIELADLAGVDLSNVTELSIGLESIGAVGGSGVVYFDDIRLTPFDRQLITPAEPDTVGLAAHYEFEGTTNDSSGNGRNGTAVGDPIFVAGKVGQAISFDGIGDYVEITGYKGILGPNAVTVTAWIKTTATETGTIVNWGTQSNGQRIDFRVNADRLRVEPGGGNIQGDSNVNDGGWHHVAVTVQANATISYPEVILWLDGIDDTRPSTDPDIFDIAANVDVSIGYRATNNDRFFMGQIDDVRIYERVLTQEEIAWLAGRTQPFDKPF